MKRFEVACLMAIAGCAICFFALKSDIEHDKEPIDFCEAPVNLQVPEEFQAKVALDSKRSGKWAALRKKFLKAHPFCAYCGSTDHLQVHHCVPFHLHPELELDEMNLITLCETVGTDHHLNIGHKGNFKNENPYVVEECNVNMERMKANGTWPIKGE